MPKFNLYAMERNSLQSYIDHKNLINDNQINLSAAEIDRIKAELTEYKSGDRVVFTKDENNEAHMNITGVLEPHPDPCAIMFGLDMTCYSDIFDDINAAESDIDINKMHLYFDTPGGNVVGLFKACDKIRNSSLTIIGHIVGMAASAGYALASQCSEIVADNESIETGSIGVLTERVDRSEQDKQNGIVRRVLVSDNTPNKHADAATESGRLQIIERLTKIKEVFVGYVANGRNTTAENVSENFGKGGVLIARDALNAGMIDKIESELPAPGTKTPAKQQSNTNSAQNTDQGDMSMDMTKEEISAIAEDAANKAASTVKADFEARDNAREAENKRVAAFQILITAYPNQKAMIEDEMKIEGSSASVDFGIKVAAAETARIAAEKEQSENSDENTDNVQTDSNSAEDKSGDNFVASFTGGTK